MATTHKVIFYPVSNGDTSQIVLSSGRRILFDFCHRKNGEDDGHPHIDLGSRLKEELNKVARDYFDVVVFTHADTDHICGSVDFFELNHAEKYQGDDRIKIKELWVPAAMLLETAANGKQKEEFVILRQEARHRLKEGKGIRVFSKPPTLIEWLTPALEERGELPSARDHLFVDAGTVVDGFSLTADGVEFFCHSPFIKHCENGNDVLRNEAALIFNIRFLADGLTFDFLQVGDSTWDVLEDMVNTSRYHNNNDRLAWNLFNVPHHCSYLALSDEKGEKETTPKPLVKELLLQGKSGACLVSSSFPITNSEGAFIQTQPPHIQAKQSYIRYMNQVGGRKFYVTMEEPNTKKPEPLEFEIGKYGLSRMPSGSVVGSFATASTKPLRAG